MTRLNLYAKTGRFDNDDYIKFLKEWRIIKHRISNQPMTRDEMSKRSEELERVYQNSGIHSLTQESVAKLIRK